MDHEALVAKVAEDFRQAGMEAVADGLTIRGKDRGYRFEIVHTYHEDPNAPSREDVQRAFWDAVFNRILNGLPKGSRP